MFGIKGSRLDLRAQLESEHAVSWSDEQERTYYAAAETDARRTGEIDDDGEVTAAGAERLLDPVPSPLDSKGNDPRF